MCVWLELTHTHSRQPLLLFENTFEVLQLLFQTEINQKPHFLFNLT